MLIWYVDLVEHIGIELNKTLKNICNLFVIDKLMYINIIPALGLQYLLLELPAQAGHLPTDLDERLGGHQYYLAGERSESKGQNGCLCLQLSQAPDKLGNSDTIICVFPCIA